MPPRESPRRPGASYGHTKPTKSVDAVIEPAVRPLEVLEGVLDEIRAGFNSRLDQCTSDQQRVRVMAELLTVRDDVQRVYAPQEARVAEASQGVSLELKLLSAQKIVKLINGLGVTRQNLPTIIQWVKLQTPYSSNALIAKHSGVARSVLSRFMNSEYERPPHEIQNGLVLIRWIRGVLSRI